VIDDRGRFVGIHDVADGHRGWQHRKRQRDGQDHARANPQRAVAAALQRGHAGHPAHPVGRRLIVRIGRRLVFVRAAGGRLVLPAAGHFAARTARAARNCTLRGSGLALGGTAAAAAFAVLVTDAAARCSGRRPGRNRDAESRQQIGNERQTGRKPAPQRSPEASPSHVVHDAKVPLLRVPNHPTRRYLSRASRPGKRQPRGKGQRALAERHDIGNNK
jgi:hypothetical protein